MLLVVSIRADKHRSTQPPRLFIFWEAHVVGRIHQSSGLEQEENEGVTEDCQIRKRAEQIRNVTEQDFFEIPFWDVVFGRDVDVPVLALPQSLERADDEEGGQRHEPGTGDEFLRHRPDGEEDLSFAQAPEQAEDQDTGEVEKTSVGERAFRPQDEVCPVDDARTEQRKKPPVRI